MNYFNNLNNLKYLIIEINNLYNLIDLKIEYISKIYKQYLEKEDNTDDDKISLDILNFQLKLFIYDNKNSIELYNIFLNNMYGDYYKLCMNLQDYINENLSQLKLKEIKLKHYNDIDNEQIFTFDDIENVYINIEKYIANVNNYIELKKNELKKDKMNDQNICINNFMNQKNYDINLIEDKITFYENNLKTFTLFHSNFYNKLLFKLNNEKIYLDQNIHPNNSNTNTNYTNNTNNRIFHINININIIFFLNFK